MFGQHLHRRVGVHLLEGAHPDDVRQDDLGRGQAVGFPARHVAARRRHEAVELTDRMMEPAGARPAVGPRIDGAIAVFLADTADLSRREVERPVPGDRDERPLAPAAAVAEGAVVEPRLPHHRLRDPDRVFDGLGHAGADGRGVGVLVERPQGLDLAVRHIDFVGAPVGRRPMGSFRSAHVRAS